VKKIQDTFIRFYVIDERDKQTDTQMHRQTPHDGKGRAAKIVTDVVIKLQTSKVANESDQKPKQRFPGYRGQN